MSVFHLRCSGIILFSCPRNGLYSLNNAFHCNNRKRCQINESIGQCLDGECKMASRESAMGHPDDIDRIALTVVEQIQQQMQVYEDDAAVSHSNEHDFKQVELHIQAKRIENIFDMCLGKIEFALSMPWIFQSDAQNDECKSIQEKWKQIYGRIESVCKQRQARVCEKEREVFQSGKL